MKVPRLVPQQSTENATTPFAQAPGPASFGATIGAELSQSGGQIQARMGKLREEKDAVRGLQLTVQAQERLNDLLYGENGLMQSQGLNADGITEKFNTQRDEIMQEIISSAENDNQKMIVAQSILRQLPGYQSQLATHEATELQKAKTASLGATIEQQMKTAVSAKGNSETMAAVKDQVERSIMAMAGHLGPEKVADMIDDEMNKIHVAVISELMVDDFATAKKYYEQYSDEIDPASGTKIKEFIKKKEETTKEQTLSEQIFTKFGKNDEDKAVEYIHKNFEGEQEDKLLARVQGMYSDERRFTEQREQQTYDRLYELVGGASSYSAALNAVEDSSLKEEHKRTLRNYAKERFNVSAGGMYPKTSPQAKAQIQDMVNRDTLFKTYPTWQSFYAAYGGALSYSDQDRYRGMYERLAKGQKPTFIYDVDKAITAKISQAKITDPVVISEIYQRANEYIKAEEEKKNGSLTPVEQTKIIDSLFTPITLEKKYLFGRDILAPDVKGQRWQVPPNSQFSEKEGRWVPSGYQWNEQLGKSILYVPETGLCYDLDGNPVARVEDDGKK